MFIDPVVDVFVDPCEPSYSPPSLREKEKFHEWTQRYVYCVVGMTQFFCKIIDPLGGRHHFLLILLDSVSDT